VFIGFSTDGKFSVEKWKWKLDGKTNIPESR